MSRGRSRRLIRKRFALYWCTTRDGDEDWFVVAASARQARRFHECEEGYEAGDATSEFVVALPDALVQGDEWRDPEETEPYDGAGWPSDTVLRACGGDIAELPRDGFRDSMGTVCKVVRFGDRVFRAGDVVTNTLERHGEREAPRLAVFTGGKAIRVPGGS